MCQTLKPPKLHTINDNEKSITVSAIPIFIGITSQDGASVGEARSLILSAHPFSESEFRKEKSRTRLSHRTRKTPYAKQSLSPSSWLRGHSVSGQRIENATVAYFCNRVPHRRRNPRVSSGVGLEAFSH